MTLAALLNGVRPAYRKGLGGVVYRTARNQFCITGGVLYNCRSLAPLQGQPVLLCVTAGVHGDMGVFLRGPALAEGQNRGRSHRREFGTRGPSLIAEGVDLSRLGIRRPPAFALCL